MDQKTIITQYKEIQEKLRVQILTERTEKMNKDLKKMLEDISKVMFWKERKKTRRNVTNDFLTVKDEKGERKYDPESIKEITAAYYERLYAKKEIRSHPHHKLVKEEMENLEKDNNKDNEWFNLPPTKQEILEEITNKKNGKATTDVKNEIIKGGKEKFIKIVMPVLLVPSVEPRSNYEHLEGKR